MSKCKKIKKLLLTGFLGDEQLNQLVGHFTVAFVDADDAEVDEAVRLWPLIETFLSQDVHDVSKPEEAFTALANILSPAAPAVQAGAARKAVR